MGRGRRTSLDCLVSHIIYKLRLRCGANTRLTGSKKHIIPKVLNTCAYGTLWVHHPTTHYGKKSNWEKEREGREIERERV